MKKSFTLLFFHDKFLFVMINSSFLSPVIVMSAPMGLFIIFAPKKLVLNSDKTRTNNNCTIIALTSSSKKMLLSASLLNQ